MRAGRAGTTTAPSALAPRARPEGKPLTTRLASCRLVPLRALTAGSGSSRLMRALHARHVLPEARRKGQAGISLA